MIKKNSLNVMTHEIPVYYLSLYKIMEYEIKNSYNFYDNGAIGSSLASLFSSFVGSSLI